MWYRILLTLRSSQSREGHTHNCNKIYTETSDYNKIWRAIMEKQRTHVKLLSFSLPQPEKVHQSDDKLKKEKGCGKYPKAA